MKKSILFIVFSLLGFIEVSGQNYFYNLNKYWWYRYRLVNDFMKIGDACGESLPAAERVPYDPTTGYTAIPYNNDPLLDPNYWNGFLEHIKWGEGTIELGQYIAVLATEYRILANNSMNTDRTVMELYYALKAFDRLDLNAEEHCRDFQKTKDCNRIYPSSDDFNGFFIRGDIPDGFVQDKGKHFLGTKICDSTVLTNSAFG